MTVGDTTARRLPREERREQLLTAARAVLARAGVDGFSLEEVAREASVAATLPRHYFRSSDRLLVIAVLQAVEHITEPVLIGERSEIAARMDRYVTALVEHPWGHELWMHSAQAHPEIAAGIRDRRRQLVERAAKREWRRMTQADRLLGLGWLGACDAIIAEWIAEGATDKRALVRLLADVSDRFGVTVA